MSRSFRLARVVLGVTAACVAAGAAAGILCAMGILFLIDGLRGLFSDALPYLAAGIIGGVCGLVLGPGAVFGFLRRVPLGRLFAETALCAGIGGLIGFALGMNLIADLALASCAFGGAVAHLARRYRENGEYTRSALPADTA